MNTLTEEQNAVVTDDALRRLVIAGPGSGKTHTLIAKVRHMVAAGTDPAGIHIVTFTNSAATELNKRLRDPTDPSRDIKPGYVGTLHGLAYRLIERHKEKVGFSTAPLGIIDAELAETLLKQNIEQCRYRGSMKSIREAMTRFNPDTGIAWSKPGVVIAAYFGMLRNNNLLDYDSMLKYAAKLAGQGCNLGATVIMVDEVQDSGSDDWAIYDGLGKHCRLFMVGDPDQAIYGFRGGLQGQILEEATKFPPLVLEGNFRSGRLICQSAQRLIENNKARLDKKTISRTNTQGTVKVYLPARTPAEEMTSFVTWFMEVPDRNPNEVAILVRINKLREQVTEFLQGMGLQVRSKELQTIPEDWAYARQCLMLIANPYNDTVARIIVDGTDGISAGSRIADLAAQQGKSINECKWNLPFDATPQQVPAILTQTLGVGIESVALFQNMLAQFPEIRTVGELGIAVAADLFHNDEGGKGITVTTIHSAKGREWDQVWIMGFEDEIIPGTRKNLNVEEERRLAYVAATRARDELHVSCCGHRPPFYGGRLPKPVQPSRYLLELMPEGWSRRIN